MARSVDAGELGRLQQLLRNPQLTERHTDKVVHFGRDSIRWEVTKQILTPLIEGDDDQERDMVFSLGFFDKRRHPDLAAQDAAGNVLSIVDRDYRALAITEIYLPPLLVRLDSVADQHRLSDHVERLIRSSKSEALGRIEEFESATADRPRLHQLVCDEEVRQDLRHLAENNHLLVWVRARPGQRVILKYQYTEALPYPTFHRAWTHGGKLGIVRLWLLLRWVLMELGLLAVPIRLRLNGANHSQAYFFIVEPPSGTEVEACYWYKIFVRQQLNDLNELEPVTTWNIQHDSAHATLACRHAERDAADREASIDLRVRRERLILPMLLVAVIAAAAWVGRSSTDELEKVLPLAAVLPGALLGVLAERLSDLGRRMTRTLQLHFVLLSVLSVTYGVAAVGDIISDKNGLGWLNDRILNGAVTLVSVWTLGLLVYPVLFRGRLKLKTTNLVYTRYSDVRSYRRDRRASALVVVLASAAAAIYLSIDDLDKHVADRLAGLTIGPDALWKLFDHASSAQATLAAVGVVALFTAGTGILVNRAGMVYRGVIVVAGLLVLVGLVWATKELFERERPAGPTLLAEDGFSMPSGHAAFSVFAALALYQNVFHRLSTRAVRASLVIVLVGYCGMVYFERMAANAHYLSDVVVGGFFGAVSYLACLRLSRLRYSAAHGLYRVDW